MTHEDRQFLRGVYEKADQLARRRRRQLLIFLCSLGLAALCCAYVLCTAWGIEANILLTALFGGTALILLCAIDWLRLQPN